jgi:uncharacterized protein involved in response to NO
MPDWLPVGVLLLVAAVLHAARQGRWCGVATLPERVLLILHVGYLWLVAGVTLLGLSLLTDAMPTAPAVHAMTADAMGTMIVAVMTRATPDHTGRALHADAAIAAFALVNAAAVPRMGWRVAKRFTGSPVRTLQPGLDRRLRGVSREIRADPMAPRT